MKNVVFILLAFLLLPLGCADPMQLKLSEADKLADVGKYGDAITIYKEIYDTKPSAEIKFKLANTYIKKAGDYLKAEDYTNAIADYKEASVYDSGMDLKKQLGDAFYKRGLTSMKQKGQVPMAISDFNAVIELDPTYKDALISRGSAYIDQGEYDKALSDLDKVIETDQVNKLAYFSHGRAQWGKGQYDAAITDLSKAIEIDKDYTDALSWRASIYNKYLMEYYKAVDDYSTIIKATSEKDSIWITAVNNRAVIYSGKLDQPAKAAEDYSTIIRLQPNNALTYYNRGWAYYSTRRYQESLADFQKYLAIDVNDIYKLRLYTSGHIDGLNRILSGAVTQ